MYPDTPKTSSEAIGAEPGDAPRRTKSSANSQRALGLGWLKRRILGNEDWPDWLNTLGLSLPGLLISGFLLRVIILQPVIPRSGDIVAFFYQAALLLRAAALTHTLPFWNPYALSGTPFLADLASATFYLPNLIAYQVLDATDGIRFYIVLHFLLAYFGMIVYLRAVCLRHLAAVTGALGFAFSGYMIVRIGAIPLLGFCAWIPLLFGLLELILNAKTPGKRLLFASALGIGMAEQILVGFPQGCYYTFIALGAYFLTTTLHLQALTSWRGLWRYAQQTAWALGLPALIALGLSAIQLLPSLEFVRLTELSAGYSDSPDSGFGLWDLWAFVSWPGSGEITTLYTGALALALAPLAVLFCRTRRTLFFGGLIPVALLLANGKNNPLGWLFAIVIPGWNELGSHVPVRILPLVVFALAVLMAWGIQSYRRFPPWAPVVAIGIFLALVAIRIGAPPLTLATVSPRILSVAVTTTLIFSGLNALVLSLDGVLRWRGIRVQGTLLVLALLVAGDQIVHDDAISLSLAWPEQVFAVRPVTRFLLDRQAESPTGATSRFYSVRPNAPNLGYFEPTTGGKYLVANAALVYGLAETNGYNPLQLARYRQFLEAVNGGVPTDYHLGMISNVVSPLIKHLSARYVVTDANPESLAKLTTVPILGQTNLQGGGPNSQVIAEAQNRAPGVLARKITIDSTLANSVTLTNQTPIGRLSVVLEDGSREEMVLRAGIDVSEHAYDRPDVRAIIEHSRAPIARSWPGGPDWTEHSYRTTLQLKNPQGVQSVKVELLRPDISWIIESISLNAAEDDYFDIVYQDQDTQVLQLKDTLPRAYLVHAAEESADDTAILNRLGDPRFDPRQSVVLTGKLTSADAATLAGASSTATTGSSGVGQDSVQFLSSEANALSMKIRSSSPGVLVLSEVYYPSWRAYVDGVPAAIYQSNYTFRAIVVSSGEHMVELRYESKAFRVGAAITFVTLFILVIGALLVLRIPRAVLAWRKGS